MPKQSLAVPDLAAIEVEGLTRSAFMVRGALAAGAVYGASTISPFVSQALAQSGGGDIEVLNFALTLEYLEDEFYDIANKRLGLRGQARELSREIGRNEQEHVDALRTAISEAGGEPVKEPRFKGLATRDERSFLKLAQTLEDTGVSAYNGAAPAIQDPKVLAAAGSIVQVEARHAAAIRSLRGQQPAPDAFDKALEQQQVLDAVKPFIAA